MKLIIDIPEELFNIAKDGMLNEIQSMFICGSVTQGTPLPKGHGRLIDAREYENSIRKHYFDNSTVIRCTEIALDNAPTIIESYKAESEEV